jgi:membrane protein DedA with SNARE-associated domain
MFTNENLGKMRSKAPQLIVVAIVIVVVVYLVLDFLEDVVIEGGPVTSEPIIALIIFITRGVTGAVRAWGYTGIFGLMLLESSSLPVPSEVILPFAGYLASLGQLDIWITVTIATVAGVAGSLIDYYIGLKGVQALTQNKILGKIVLSTKQLEVAEKWFTKYGSLMIFTSRMIPGFRTTFSFPAGAVKMKLSKFIGFTVAGCFLWNVILVYLGWYLGKNWTQVAGISHYLIIAAVAAIAIIIIVYIVKKRPVKKQTLKNLQEEKLGTT